jgi:hypothetical protein
MVAMVRTALITVVTGDAYVAYSDALFDSAREFFKPTEHVDFIRLDGREGWPAATMFRWEVCLENWAYLERYDALWLSDADMLFEGTVGAEVIPPTSGTVATLHPGYVGKHHLELPYEQRPESSCYIVPAEGDVYYAGGFAGGDREGFHWLASRIRSTITSDVVRGITPRFHDESALNKVLGVTAPDVTLDPSMCHPDSDDYYLSFWPEPYPRLLVALDKTQDERGER